MAISRFCVEAGHIMMFARAVGDDNVAYQGALAGDDDVPAPPTFVQASAQYDPEYLLRPRPGDKWFGSARTDGFVSNGGVGLHAEQHFEYHRPLRAGMALSTSTRIGGTWQKEGRRGGKLVFTEMITEYRDEGGDLVVTARGVSVKTQRVVEQVR